MAWIGFGALAAGAARPASIRQVEDISDVAQFFVWPDGWLDVKFTPTAELCKADVTPFRVKGSEARWGFRVTAGPVDGDLFSGDERVMELSYEDTGDERKLGHVKATVAQAGESLLITAMVRMENRTVRVRYRGRGDINSVQVEVYAHVEGEIGESLMDTQADTLRALADENVEDFNRYMRPLLSKLARRDIFGPAAGDVYSVFANVLPDAALRRKLEDLLPGLDDADVAVREGAMNELRQLGGAGVLAAMRADRSELTPEQRSRLNRLVEGHRRRWIADAQAARRNPWFLLECLEYEDAVVRAEAKKSLEEALGRTIAFDPAKGWDERAQAVGALRRELQKAGGGEMVGK